MANGWRTVGHGASGQYINGAYQISVKKGNTNYGFAAPTGAPTLNPAPRSITIDVSARQAGGGNQTLYGIICRSDRLSNNDYQFGISSGYASISKYVDGNYKLIAQDLTAPVRANGTNQLQATCASAGSQNAVHLVFWVNGKKILDKIDRTNPITKGTVGLIAYASSNSQPGIAEFDNFIVTRT